MLAQFVSGVATRSLPLLTLGYLGMGSLTAQAEVKFEVVTPGVLAVGSERGNVLRTTTPAMLKVYTDAPLHLRLEPPTRISGASPEADDTRKRATVIFSGGQVASDDPEPQFRLPQGMTELVIEMTIEQSTLFRAGSYLYQINLSSVP